MLSVLFIYYNVGATDTSVGFPARQGANAGYTSNLGK
jgi:hypothetical protein